MGAPNWRAAIVGRILARWAKRILRAWVPRHDGALFWLRGDIVCGGGHQRTRQNVQGGYDSLSSHIGWQKNESSAWSEQLHVARATARKLGYERKSPHVQDPCPAHTC